MSSRWHWCGVAILGLVVGSGGFALPARAEDAVKLSYGFQKGKQYAYDVKIVADLPDEELTRSGVLTYNILDADETQFTVQPSGVLGTSTKFKAGAGGFGGPRGFFPPAPRFPHHFGPFAQPVRPAGTTFSRQGVVNVIGNVADMPFLLGCEEGLIVEPFPAEAKAAWDTQTGTGVIERDQSRHRIGPLSETEVARGATEKVEYAVLETGPDAVRVSKKYSLQTNPESGGITHIEMTGNGEFTFDRKEGVIKSQTMKYEIAINEKNVKVTVPFTLTCRMLTANQLAELKKKAEAARVAAEEAARPKPIADADRQALIQDLLSGDAHRIDTAAQRLQKGIRDDHAPEISRALCRAIRSSGEWQQSHCLQALGVWATPEAETTIVTAAKSQNFMLNGPAIEALHYFKSPAAAEVAAAALTDGGKRGNAAKALKEMGQVAEPYVIPHLGSHDVFTRGEALKIVAVIGGNRSLQALKAELPRAAWHEKDELQRTIAAVEARIEAGEADKEPVAAAAPSEPAAESAPAASAAQQSRTWHDVTGTYSIEATLVRYANGKVTLKKADGREITLPAAKLSAADRAFVEKNAKPPNPFE